MTRRSDKCDFGVGGRYSPTRKDDLCETSSAHPHRNHMLEVVIAQHLTHDGQTGKRFPIILVSPDNLLNASVVKTKGREEEEKWKLLYIVMEFLPPRDPVIGFDCAGYFKSK